MDTRCTINQYLTLISKRAAGKLKVLFKLAFDSLVHFPGALLTNATWMRHFVSNHPAYKHDSVVTDEIAYDLLWKMTQISHFGEPCPEVLPKVVSKTTLDISAAIEKDHNELEVKRLLMHHNNHNENSNNAT